MNVHESGEMYLEAILVLQRKQDFVRSVDVGEYLGYSKPSVSRAMGLLRKGKSRGFSIDIETDSTVLTDEQAEKHGRAEFLGAFSTAAQSLMLLAGAGEEGAKLGGGIL